MASAEKAKQFQEQGYLIVEDFLSADEADNLRKACAGLVDDMNPEEHNTVFSTEKQNFRNDYFINSQDKIGYFFEDGALDNDGKLTVNKQESLNKIGHAMHVFEPTFRQLTFSQKVKDVVKNMGFVDPVVMQSMYIFKQPRLGGKVVCHQDSSFLYTDPQRVMGLWMALEDATEENGCLWFIPGSHKEGLHGNYRMIRNPDPEGTQSCTFEGTKPEYNQADFVAGPVKKGTLVVIDGLIVHKSEPNKSQKSRHAFTLHLYDAATAKWSDKNWMQPTDAGTFQHLNEVKVD